MQTEVASKVVSAKLW